MNFLKPPFGRNAIPKIFPAKNVHGTSARPEPRRRTDSSHHERRGSYRPFKYVSLMFCLPIIAVLSLLNYREHQHEKMCYVRPPFVKYTYMYIRSKRFPWGDGTRSLFHNKDRNALPDGYEA